MNKVIKIERKRSTTLVVVQGKVRKVEYLFDSTTDTDAEITQAFEASQKDAAVKYNAEISLP